MAVIIGSKIGEHDSCVALIKDGEVKAVYEEERFNRIKHGVSCESTSLWAILADFNLKIEDVDYFTNCIDESLIPERLKQIEDFFPPERAEEIAKLKKNYSRALPTYRNLLRGHGVPPEKIVNIRHHLCHIAGVYYPSNFSEAAVISIDGGGEAENAVIAACKGNQIEILESNPQPHSLGHLYLAFTEWLGWGYGEEGKTMALASFGKPIYLEKLLSEFIKINQNGFIQYKQKKMASLAIRDIFGPARDRNAPLTQRHKDMAATVQELTNQVLISLATTAKKLTQCDNLILTGGVALNSVSNGVVLQKNIFKNIQAYPQSNDSGTAIGGALWVAHNKLGYESIEWPNSHAYLGQDIDIQNCKKIAAKYQLQLTKLEQPEEKAAELLAHGKIVGWIQDRSEIGPRALGNRSILADSRNGEMHRLVNEKIKNRENWRPFAPSVLEEDTSIYFETEQKLPFMVIVCQVQKKWRDKLKSVVHIDGSARVQSVSKQTNPKFHKLIDEFKKRTGVSVVLNTSFNDRGEPIVSTVNQAVRLFVKSQMDDLIIGNQHFQKSPRSVQPKDISPFRPISFNLDRLPPTADWFILSLEDEHEEKILNDLLREAKSRNKLVYLVEEFFSKKDAESRYINYRSYFSWVSKNKMTCNKNSEFILIGRRHGKDWAFEPNDKSVTMIDLTLNLANKLGGNAYGIDYNGGLTALSIPQKTVRLNKYEQTEDK